MIRLTVGEDGSRGYVIPVNSVKYGCSNGSNPAAVSCQSIACPYSKSLLTAEFPNNGVGQNLIVTAPGWILRATVCTTLLTCTLSSEFTEA
jgi:hypothetical protein